MSNDSDSSDNAKVERLDKEAAAVTVVESGSDDSYALGPGAAWRTGEYAIFFAYSLRQCNKLPVLGGFLLQFCVAGPVTAFGVFQDFYSSTWLSNFSQSDISWIGSVQLFIAFGLGTLAGRLYDYGYCRHVLLAGSLVFTISFFMISLTQPQRYYQVFLSQGLGLGIGYALVYIPTMTVVSHHFRKRKALGMGILVAGGPLGSVIFSIMLNQLVHHGPGFRWAVRAVGFVVAGCFGLGNALIAIPPPSAASTHSNASTSIKVIWTDLPFILTLISGFVAQLGTFFPIFYIQVFASGHGLSKSLTFYSLAIINVSSIFGRIVPNFFADRFGVLNTFIICVGINGAVGFLMLLASHTAGLVIFCILYGFFFGSTISLYMPAVAYISPTKANMGAVMGVGITPVGVASLIGPPIAGAILGSELIWWKGVTFASVVLISASGIEFVARYLRHRSTS
ncbi:MFS general substrate transporter [Pholiota conissans]|uniref:MFS general substrate transporter n=1 Tax=Pholiota conissans TaxID=109636 RepID=A0A9P6CS42_9AGAR|nr:MFS general substrate transporter [Pholiota conissans]